MYIFRHIPLCTSLVLYKSPFIHGITKKVTANNAVETFKTIVTNSPTCGSNKTLRQLQEQFPGMDKADMKKMSKLNTATEINQELGNIAERNAQIEINANLVAGM